MENVKKTERKQTLRVKNSVNLLSLCAFHLTPYSPNYRGVFLPRALFFHNHPDDQLHLLSPSDPKQVKLLLFHPRQLFYYLLVTPSVPDRLSNPFHPKN